MVAGSGILLDLCNEITFGPATPPAYLEQMYGWLAKYQLLEAAAAGTTPPDVEYTHRHTIAQWHRMFIMAVNQQQQQLQMLQQQQQQQQQPPQQQQQVATPTAMQQ